jgi:hypothetical protein
MTKLPAEAYAIVEGRHADPFHYLGLHKEGGKTVVRAFLPEATQVDAVGAHGEAAKLTRIHEAGLFAGAAPAGAGHYQLRARFGNNVSSSKTPIASRRCSAITTSICSAKARISASMTSSARIR